MEGSTPKIMEAYTTNALAVKKICFNPPSIPTRATVSTIGRSATYVDSALFKGVCLEKSHRLAQCPFIPNLLRKRFAMQRKKNLTNRRSRPQKKFGYQAATSPNRLL